MALTPEQIAREIEGIGTDLPRDLGGAIDAATQEVLEAIRANAPIGDTGALRDSINAQFNAADLTLGISMLAYGYFQNFGVAGTKNEKLQFGVPEVVANVLPPRSGNIYSFNPEKQTIAGDLPFGVRKSIHQKGLNAKQFLDLDSFVNRVAELVNQNLEL